MPLVLTAGEEREAQRKAILNALERVDDGAFVLVDSMDSRSGRLCISIQNRAPVQVVGGVNLPMLSKVLSAAAAKKYLLKM